MSPSGAVSGKSVKLAGEASADIVPAGHMSAAEVLADHAATGRRSYRVSRAVAADLGLAATPPANGSGAEHEDDNLKMSIDPSLNLEEHNDER